MNSKKEKKTTWRTDATTTNPNREEHHHQCEAHYELSRKEPKSSNQYRSYSSSSHQYRQEKNKKCRACEDNHRREKGARKASGQTKLQNFFQQKENAIETGQRKWEVALS
jgi:hypothetical protein